MLMLIIIFGLSLVLQGGEIDVAHFLSAIGGYGAMLTSLLEQCDLPVLCLCHGATRGGGMLFPAISDFVVCTSDASFGFPEIRRGVLPGVVSVPALKRLSQHQCRRWMLTGDVMTCEDALGDGFIDVISESKPTAQAEV
jgi:enoyl-CoA hydratase/carnithine racemase